MHDLRFIREQPDAFDEGLRRRGLQPMAPHILDLDAKRRAAQTAMQEMQQRRNEASKEIGAAKKSGGDATGLMAEVQALKDRMAAAEEAERGFAATLKEILETLPNLPAADVPDGADERANREERRVAAPRNFDFEAKEHFEIGEALGLMDFETAAKLSGSRFVVLKGALARLERAIANFMLTLHTETFGYTEVAPPLLVRSETLYGTGQLPKFADDLYRTGEDYWLIPTAEVPLTGMAADTVLEAAALPVRVTAWTPCFRSEAGAAGKDTRGMLRQHQFSKVELVSVTHPDQSDAELARMTGCAEEVLKRLGLPYRVVTLCTGDMGFGARKTHDIEVWLPGQGAYREISSCSSCGDFQARRMNARFRTPGEKGTRFVHTLNGSGLAVGRTLIAILENGQQADGSVAIPEALRPFMGGLERIAKGV
ncbi:MAG: serine--tRNA ligase [Alphaproteobacteria bacterium]|nr:serine--tRNA ligase [Alphaproteobacteria bacterium]